MGNSPKLPVNGPAKTPKEVLKRAEHLEQLANRQKDPAKKARLKHAAKLSRWAARTVQALRGEEAEKLTAEALEKARESALRRK